MIISDDKFSKKKGMIEELIKTEKVNRCTIVQFFDSCAVVDEYVYLLLKQLKKISNKIFFVSNCELDDDTVNKVLKTADSVIMRKNEGCDAGSYRDIILNYLGETGIKQYDEIIFCNTTFFGFFIPIEDIFEHLEQKNCEFWGIGYIDSSMFSYLQGYFTVYKNKIIKNGDLYHFFNIILPENINGRHSSAIYFETGIYRYMISKGYKCASFIEKTNYYIFGSSAFSVLKDGYPILKKRAFAPEFYDHNTLMYLLKQLFDNKIYDVNLILSAVNRNYNLRLDKTDITNFTGDKCDVKTVILGECSLSYDEVHNFLCSNKHIYVFGVGFYGMLFLEVMKDELQNVCGIAVSDEKKQELSKTLYIKDELIKINDELLYNGYHIKKVSEIPESDAAIVVALDYKNSVAVKSNFKRFKKVLYLWDNV